VRLRPNGQNRARPQWRRVVSAKDFRAKRQMQFVHQTGAKQGIVSTRRRLHNSNRLTPHSRGASARGAENLIFAPATDF